MINILKGARPGAFCNANYRNADVPMVDDVQFIIKQDSTKEEFLPLNKISRMEE